MPEEKKTTISRETIEEYRAKYPDSFKLLLQYTQDEEMIVGMIIELENTPMDDVYHDIFLSMARKALIDAITSQFGGMLESIMDKSEEGEGDSPKIHSSGKLYDA